MKAVGISTPDVYHMSGTQESAGAFYQAITAAKEASGHGFMVDAHDVAQLSKMKLFMTADGKAGFAVRRNGEITAVFSHPDGSHPSAGASLMNVAVDHGGKWLDAFDTVLPQLYSVSGFRPVARIKFDPEQIPPGWDAAKVAMFNDGKPDVVFMVYDPKFKDPVNRNTGGSAAKDWDTAMKLTKAAVKKYGIKRAN